jgi:hypothetical protein
MLLGNFGERLIKLSFSLETSNSHFLVGEFCGLNKNTKMKS